MYVVYTNVCVLSITNMQEWRLLFVSLMKPELYLNIQFNYIISITYVQRIQTITFFIILTRWLCFSGLNKVVLAFFSCFISIYIHNVCETETVIRENMCLPLIVIPHGVQLYRNVMLQEKGLFKLFLYSLIINHFLPINPCPAQFEHGFCFISFDTKEKEKDLSVR